MNTIQTRTIIAQQPAHLPAPHWHIYNAPRPLYGHLTWQGEFVSGIFYAAVCDLAEDAERLTDLNRRDAAVELCYVSEDFATDEQVEYYLRHFPHMSIDDVIAYDTAHHGAFIQSYLSRVNA